MVANDASALGATAGLAVWVTESGPAGRVSPRLPLAFESFLYLQPSHQDLQQSLLPVVGLFLENTAAGRTVAQFYVVLGADGPGLARSPGQATFGGLQMASGVTTAALHLLLDAAEATLRQHGQFQLTIRGYPFCYDPAGAVTFAEALRQRGYPVIQAEENYYLDTTRDFVAHLHASERRRLRRCQRAGLVVEQEPPLLLPAAYAFLAACRQERGQPPLSLPLERLQELFAAFPQRHILLSVREPVTGAWLALTVAIEASSRVLHNFYPASPRHANAQSPMVLLLQGLHAWGAAQGLAVLDLGRSTLPSGPHVSLLRFKRHLGGLPSLKLTWQVAL